MGRKSSISNINDKLVEPSPDSSSLCRLVKHLALQVAQSNRNACTFEFLLREVTRTHLHLQTLIQHLTVSHLRIKPYMANNANCIGLFRLPTEDF